MAVRLSLVMTLAAGIALFAIASAPAQSPPAAKPEMRENCPGLVASKMPRAIPAALQLALNPDQVRISYSGHSTFLVESPQLVRIATDYNDYVRPVVLPDIATMNHAHSTHYTDRPDPRIPHVLRGWGPSPEQPARHDVQVRDVRVRNVPTNIRDWAGGTERHGNSIFIFEMANMCIAHLGHLHHTLTQQQLDEIGPHRHRVRPRRRHADARHRGHDRCPAVDEGAAHDPDALLQLVHAASLPRRGQEP